MTVMPKLVIFMCLIIVSESRSSGAPSKTCIDMTPHHRGNVPQTSTPPFIIDVSPLDDTSSTFSVKIISPSNEEFRGFLLQARLHTNKDIILHGSFSDYELAQERKCKDGVGNYLTHINKESKSMVQSTWTPPANFKGEIIFRATVVERYEKFWVGIESDPIFANGTDVVATTVSSKRTELAIYSECGATKGCFALPDGCLSTSSCELIFSYVYEESFFNLQLIGEIGDKGWIAIGLSYDQKMGDDSVTECIYEDGKYTLQQSWNVKDPNDNERISNPQGSIVEKTEQSYVEKLLTCSWKQNNETFVKDHVFNIMNERYYLLLAIGEVSSSGVKLGHYRETVSAYKVDLTKISSIEGKSPLLIKIHGSFMVAAWIFLVSVGILLARYYKQVWEGSRLCKTKIWFAFHRAIMLLAVSLIIAAFVVIFLHKDGWSEAYPHSILGCVTTGLALIQVIAGIARPNPNSSKRPAFNWLHWLNGNLGQILAIITIFFAIPLKKASLPTYSYWILIGYIAFHLIFHLTMQFHSCCMDKKADSNDIKLHQLGQKRETEIVKDAPGGGFRRFMLGIYVFVSSATVTALVLIICLH